MIRTAAIIITIAALCLEGNSPAQARCRRAPGACADARAAQKGKKRRSRSRRRRAQTATNCNAPATTDQPAHMAPQLEDIPPVKPQKTPTPTPPDIRNPTR